ncbi:hypothetical protein BJ741DRAFT_40458 [Chytriomyces cf. hyalinus JEL632]|nr:hypothetical protein BJ741DRAFT_40458 [Chytriomyces cf. hyalinus JEL632]
MSESTSKKCPKPFNGHSLIEFNIHHRELIAYAESKRIAHCLAPDWRVSPVPPAARNTNAHPHPGGIDDLTPDEVNEWKLRVELYKIEKADNESSLRQFNHLTAVRKAEIEANGEAILLIKHCFKDSVFRRTQDLTNASAKLTTIATMFSLTHASAMSSQWITLWSNLKLNEDTSVKKNRGIHFSYC